MLLRDKILIATTVFLVGAAVVSVGKKAVAVVEASRPSAPFVRVSDWEGLASPGARIGPHSADVTIVEFVDYGCGPCRAFQANVDEVLREYPKRVSLVVRHLPRVVPAGSHAAAAAAICSENFGVFETYHRVLLSKTPLDPDSMTAWAYEVGIADTTAFQQCLGSPDVRERLKADTTTANALDVTMTPGIFVNGSGYLGNQPLLKKIVEATFREMDKHSSNASR